MKKEHSGITVHTLTTTGQAIQRTSLKELVSIPLSLYSLYYCVFTSESMQKYHYLRGLTQAKIALYSACYCIAYIS